MASNIRKYVIRQLIKRAGFPKPYINPFDSSYAFSPRVQGMKLDTPKVNTTDMGGRSISYDKSDRIEKSNLRFQRDAEGTGSMVAKEKPVVRRRVEDLNINELEKVLPKIEADLKANLRSPAGTRKKKAILKNKEDRIKNRIVMLKERESAQKLKEKELGEKYQGPKIKGSRSKKQSPLEKRIEQEKKLDEILEDPNATIRFQDTEGTLDDVIDIPTGMSAEAAAKRLADFPIEIGSGSSLVGRISKLSPTTIERSKAVDFKSPEAKKLVKIMNRLEDSELKQDKLLSQMIGTEDFYKFKELRKDLDAQIKSITNKEDRARLRQIFREMEIPEGEPVKVRPTSRTKRDTGKVTITRATTARDPDKKEFSIIAHKDRKKDDPDSGKVTVTEGTTSRDPSKGLTEIDVSPNIVGQASDPQSKVTKLRINADPGLARKRRQEFFNDRVQNYIDQGDDLDTARIRARDDIGERDLSEDYTGDQLKELLGEGVLETDRGGLRDEATEMLEQQMRALIPKEKKKGGQISKPVKNKRKIKTSVRGNDLVAMMYD